MSAGAAAAAEESAAGALFCGVDVGSTATKAAVIDASGALRGHAVLPSGVDYRATARSARDAALAAAQAGPERVARTAATGHGREAVGFAAERHTEIRCHGVGAFHLLRRAVTVVDIGGQDTKVVRLDDAGHVQHFRVNRKCAAGTGAFLEEIALRLALPLAELDALAAASADTAPLSSFCTVFAKTEILALLRRGVPIGAIARGALAAVVTRVVELDPLTGEIALTGGVAAHVPTVVALLGERLGRAVTVPAHPQLAGALGAALVARGARAPAAPEPPHA